MPVLLLIEYFRIFYHFFNSLTNQAIVVRLIHKRYGDLEKKAKRL